MKEKSRELYFSKGKPLCFPKSATNNKNGSEVGKDNRFLLLLASLSKESQQGLTPLAYLGHLCCRDQMLLSSCSSFSLTLG